MHQERQPREMQVSLVKGVFDIPALSNIAVGSAHMPRGMKAPNAWYCGVT